MGWYTLPGYAGRRADGLETGDEIGAGPFAAPAHIGANAAVFVHAGVLVAFVCARTAGRAARFQCRSGDVCVVAGVSGKHVGGGGADVGAVEVSA